MSTEHSGYVVPASPTKDKYYLEFIQGLLYHLLLTLGIIMHTLLQSPHVSEITHLPCRNRP